MYERLPENECPIPAALTKVYTVKLTLKTCFKMSIYMAFV